MTGRDWIFAGIVLILLGICLVLLCETGILLYRRKMQKGGEDDEVSELPL